MPRTLIEFDSRELATLFAALRHWQATDSADTEKFNAIAADGDVHAALTNEEIDGLCERMNFTEELKPAGYYSRPVTMPKTKREGLCNAVQMIINALETDQTQSPLFAAVDLLTDLACKPNPYNVPGPAVTRASAVAK